MGYIRHCRVIFITTAANSYCYANDIIAEKGQRTPLFGW